MEEVKRFMRYVLPGVVCVTEIVLAFFFSMPDMVINVLKNVKGIESIGIIIGALLASGGLGYFFSVIYYFFWNILRCYYNHEPVLCLLIEKGKWSLLDYKGNYISPKNLTRKQKWEVFHSLWHSVRGRSSALRKSDERTERLLDIMHGHGTTLAGSSIALALWYLYRMNEFSYCLVTSIDKIIFWCWIILLLLILYLYCKTRTTVVNIMNMALVNLILKMDLPFDTKYYVVSGKSRIIKEVKSILNICGDKGC